MGLKITLLIDGKEPEPKLGLAQARITEGINQISFLELILAADKQDLNPKNYVGHKATLKFSGDNKSSEMENRYDGLVYRFGSLQTPWVGPSLYAYRMVVRPAVWKLNLSYGSRIFRNMTVPKAVSQVLNSGGLVDKTDYRLQLINQSAYPQEEQIVQYRETDLGFVGRSLENAGINYYFSYSDSNSPEKLSMCDDRSYFTNPFQDSIPYEVSRGLVSEKPHVSSFELSHGFSPKQIKVETHQKLSPHQKFSSQREIQGGNDLKVRLFGNPGLNQEEAARMAKIGSEELASRQVQGSGGGNVARFRAGEIFPLALKPNQPAQKFLLTEVEHTASQNPEYSLAKDKSGFEYANRFRVVKADVDFRPGKISFLLSSEAD